VLCLPLLSTASLVLQGLLPRVSTWAAVEQWLKQGGAGGEVLLVFENTEDVLLHERSAKVGVVCYDNIAMLCSGLSLQQPLCVIFTTKGQVGCVPPWRFRFCWQWWVV
jgi:hypothetical protein